jgi:hypothetical protein
MKTIQLTVLILTISVSLLAQANVEFGEKEQAQIIGKAISLLRENYIYPERVAGIEAFLNNKLRSGGYKEFVKPQDFLENLNADLEREGRDHHLDISFGPERVKQIKLEQQNEKTNNPQEFNAEFMMRMRYENFRLRKIERLDGNIGYFNFLNFPPLDPSKESLVGALNFLRYSSAIIVDLRENGGGYADTMNFLVSYFLKDGTQIGEWRSRKENQIRKVFVPADAMVNKIPDDIPVYILVSNRTSSAAEGFSGTLQQFRKAVLVGEQTKGEGNPGELFIINDFLYIMIPTVEARNPVTGKSIDGIGLTPDIKISPDKAFAKALLEICTQLAKTAHVDELKRLYQWQIPLLENELNPEPLTEKIASAIKGEYEGNRKIVYENGKIYYIGSQGNKWRLEYIGKGVFQDTEQKWARIVLPFTDKPVPQFDWIYDDGKRMTIKRMTK